MVKGLEEPFFGGSVPQGVRELESNVDIWIQLIRKVYIDQVDRYVDITHTDVVDPYKPYGST